MALVTRRKSWDIQHPENKGLLYSILLIRGLIVKSQGDFVICKQQNCVLNLQNTIHIYCVYFLEFFLA